MKKTKLQFISRISLSVIFLLWVVVLIWFGSVSYAQTENNDLIDAVNQKDLENIWQMQEKLEFSQFSSCMDMETMLWEFLKQFKDDDRYGPYGNRGLVTAPEMLVGASKTAVLDSATDTVAPKNTIQSSNNEFSNTNVQKANVDEPEIIKTNGNEIFYYNRQEQKIYSIKSPLDTVTSTINLDTAEILTVINLPEKLYNPQLFVTDDRLVILASRYISLSNRNSVLNRDSRTSVAIYDISSPENIKLLKFTDMDGSYQNSRMIDNKLYVLSQLDINRWNLKKNGGKFNSKLLPRVLDIDVMHQALKTIVPECNAVSYILPSKDTIKEIGLYPVFTVISVLDIEDVSKDTTTNVVLANAGEIHMSTKSLYLAQTLWTPRRSTCPLWSRCMMPWIDEGQNTLIHKFAIDNFKLDYIASNIIPGSLLTQYSMDEDTAGNFRILTKKNRSDWTNFYALDKNLDLKWMIDWIQPGEEFKSSRYIGDKLYLTTFKRTDPLFVIDIADIEKPKIVWELMIPGFSSYLHPMWWIENNIQYLIWLGYGANELGRQEWLQLSLYKINYGAQETEESRCGRLAGTGTEEEYANCLKWVSSDNIRVSQVDSTTLWWKWSFSEAMENPRMFVIDKNNVVTLPMVLINEKTSWERCNIYKDENGVEVTKDCYPVTKQITSFAWLKSFSFDKVDGISQKNSIDYRPIFTKLYKSTSDYRDIDIRNIRNIAMRVGFAGDALYMINNDFAHFVLPNAGLGKYIYFNSKL